MERVKYGCRVRPRKRRAAAVAEARSAPHVWTGRLRRSSAVGADDDVVLATSKRRRANVVVDG